MKTSLRIALAAVLVVAFLFSMVAYPLTLLLLGVPAILILTDFKHTRNRMVRVFRWFPWVGSKPLPLGGVLLTWTILATAFGVLIYRNTSSKTAASQHLTAATKTSATAVVKPKVYPTPRPVVHPTPHPLPRSTSRPSAIRPLESKSATPPQPIQTFVPEVFSIAVFAKAFHQAMAEEAIGINEVTGLDISPGNSHTVIPPMQDAQKHFQHAFDTFIHRSGGSPYDDVSARTDSHFVDVAAGASSFLGDYPDPPTKADYDAIFAGYRGLRGIQQELAAKGY